MNWLKKLFQNKPVNSASVAKERLQVIVSHERIQRSSPDFLPKLQKEITEVIAKYVNIGPDEVRVDFDQQGDRQVLELNIMLPEDLTPPKKPAAAKKPAAKKASKKAATAAS